MKYTQDVSILISRRKISQRILYDVKKLHKSKIISSVIQKSKS